MPIDVVVRSGEDVRTLRQRAERYDVLGRIAGRVVESQAQRAFLEQRLGELTWPERYPGQDDPFVNIAAMVHWVGSGGSILSRFFDRRPAIMGQGNLARSIASRMDGNTVEVGSALPYAGLHQWGGSSSQPITMQAKRTIARFIGEEPDGKGGWRKKKAMGTRQAANRAKYWFKLFPLLSMDELTTEVHQRPYLGITDDGEREMVESIEHWIAEGDA